MVAVDVPHALALIRQFSEEDYEVARASLRRDLTDQYVLERGHTIIGVTGARPSAGTEDTWWLSWTYLAAAERGQGLGQTMMLDLCARLAQQGGRTLFVTTSTMRDAAGERVYEAAIRAYQRAGFVLEVEHPHYYAPEDGQLVLSRRLRPLGPATGTLDGRGLCLTTMEEIVETDDAWAIDWRFAEPGEAPDDHAAVAARVMTLRAQGARVVFVGLPSDAPQAEIPFRLAGFRPEGRLSDFYEDGVHEHRFRLDLPPLR